MPGCRIAELRLYFGGQFKGNDHDCILSLRWSECNPGNHQRPNVLDLTLDEYTCSAGKITIVTEPTISVTSHDRFWIAVLPHGSREKSPACRSRFLHLGRKHRLAWSSTMARQLPRRNCDKTRDGRAHLNKPDSSPT